jgi:hypothetical protein
MPEVEVTIHTDPACPFGFNAQRQETQLAWHYGDGLQITRRMIVLAVSGHDHVSRARDPLELTRHVGNHR